MTVSIHQLEARRQAVQRHLDAQKSLPERNRFGQFATPHALALEMAHCLAACWKQGDTNVRFADPAVGTGSFYSAALQVFGPGRIASAVGIEVDPRFHAAANNLWASRGLQLVQGDFTEWIADRVGVNQPNLILANPPYVRHHHVPRGEKERLRRLIRKTCGVEVSGLAGLYVYFLLLVTAWMKDGGLAAWLVPSEFMDVNYGAALKQVLTTQVTLERLHRFDPAIAQFGDALVSSVVLLLRKSPPVPGHTVAFTYGGTLTQPAVTQHIPVSVLHSARKWTAYPGSNHDRHRAPSGPGEVTLGDLFRITRGIATGANKFFILPRAEARRLCLPDSLLRPILPSPRLLRHTVIERAPDGYPRIDPQLCLLDCRLPEHTVERCHPPLWEYLRLAQTHGLPDRYLCRKRVPWYRQEQREPAPFLCTYMGRGQDDHRPFRFIWNRSDAIATNLYLMLFPRTSLAQILEQTPARVSEIHALLNAVTGYELRQEGRVYGGGLHKIEPGELARISAARFIERLPGLVEALGRQDRPLPRSVGLA
ncbi:MAG: class I SAM-dependent methyltransferase [Phycisphaerae bacterium]|nr:class I SAM-dependent methyltransferase [Phycisphaerae bacterium]